MNDRSIGLVDNRVEGENTEVFVYTRESPRHPTTILARIEDRTTLRECRGNVSAGGFCFEYEEELPPGVQVELLFRIPGAGFWIKGQGVVLGCVPGNGSVGVRGRFVNIESGDTGILEEWVDKLHRLSPQRCHDNTFDEATEDPHEITLFSTTLD